MTKSHLETGGPIQFKNSGGPIPLRLSVSGGKFFFRKAIQLAKKTK
jgi:hypothetical protein